MKEMAILPSATNISLPTVRYAYPFHRRPASPGQHTLQALLPSIADDKAIAGNYSYQIMKLLLDRRKIRKYVGMIKFQIIEYCRSWAEMDKFGALVEKSGVIFIRFDDKKAELAESGR